MNLSPLPKQKFFDNDGNPLVGGLLFTYAAGTSTKTATYRDRAGNLNTNPIVLDYRGEANIWLDIDISYKLVLSPRGDTDPPTKPIWSVDNISAPITLQDLTAQIIGLILYPITQTEIDAGVTPVAFNYIPGDVRRYGAIANGTADSTNAFNVATSMAGVANSGQRVVRAPGKYLIDNPILIDNVFNQGIWLEIDELVAGTNGAWSVDPPDWLSAEGMIKVGTASAGAPININVNIGSIRGASRRADGIHIADGNYGCGLSHFNVGDVQECNIFVRGNDSAIWPTSSNRFTGNSVKGCRAGFYLTGDPVQFEGAIIDYNFIWSCDYGGIIAGYGTQYLDVRSQMDFSGGQLTEFRVSSLSTFVIGSTITGGTSGKTAELVAVYTYETVNYLLGIEWGKPLGGVSQFINGETVTSGAASATLGTTRSTNQGGNGRYFDIILAANTQPFHRAFIRSTYLGGIVGANLFNCVIEQGNSNDSIIERISGLGFAAGGGNIVITDELNGGKALELTPTLFAPGKDVYLSGSGVSHKIYSADASVLLPNGVATTIFSFSTAQPGATYLVASSDPSDVNLRAHGIVTVASSGAVVYDNIANANLTLSFSGTNLQGLHGTGSSKTVYASITRIR